MIFRFIMIAMTLVGVSYSAVAQIISDDFYVPSIDPANSQRQILAGDKILVSIHKVGELSGGYNVDQEGNVDFPLIGKVKAAGLTPSEFEKILIELYGKDFLRDPFIRVEMRTSFEVEDILAYEEKIDPRGTLPEADDLQASIFSTEDEEVVISSEFISEINGSDVILFPSEETNLSEENMTLDEGLSNVQNLQSIVNSQPMLENSNWTFKDDPRAFIQFLSHEEIAGYTGCNNFYANYQHEITSLKIKFVAITMNECVDIKDAELQEIFESITNYQISPEGDLRLMNENNEVLFLLEKGLNGTE